MRLLTVAIGAVLSSLTFSLNPAWAAPPNIVFVLADDLGWSELGCYGNGFNETPNLDQLAAEGVRFTQAYAAAPVCSPYRAAFLTGKFPARLGILDFLRPNSANALSTAHKTLPKLLKQRGYATGMIGKWHLTGYEHHGAEHEIKPVDHGFDWDFAREVKGVGNGANFWPYVFRDQSIRWLDIAEQRLGEDEYLVDRMNLEAVDFIERNRDRPFFLYLSHFAPHSILHGKPGTVEKYRQKHKPGKSTRTKCYLCQDQGREGDALNHWAGDHNPHLAAMLESIDDGVGMIREKLHELGLAENTIFVFTSDNGGETNVTSNAPLRGGKSQLYEGGIRVPMIVAWPAQSPRNSVCDQPTMNVDFYPTFAEAAGKAVMPKQNVDGVSTLSVWRKPRDAHEPRTLYWHYPLDRPHFLGGRSAGAIRDGDWKLIEYFDESETELFDLAKDPSETTNLAATMKPRVKLLKRKLETWRKNTEARRPSAPLLVEPRGLAFADHFEPKQVSSRWGFNKDWQVAEGRLKRTSNGDSITRIFLKEANYGDALIRFDFQFQGAKDLRLVTGGDGHYNAVVHILPDHFYIQTAIDRSIPYFPHRHGECRFDFQPNQWYTMTVEFLGDQLVAHIDRKHLAFAEHPILNRTRKYFAFQVDSGSAAFDNVQIFSAAKSRKFETGLRAVRTAAGKHPVPKSVDVQRSIAKTNAHSRLFREDAKYRSLVERVEQLDEKGKQQFPDVMKSHKEYRKAIALKRKSLKQNDVRYQELERASNRAKQAVDRFLMEQESGVRELKGSPRVRAIERLRRRWNSDERYLVLERARLDAAAKLQNAFPELYVTDKQIVETKRKTRKAYEQKEEFKSFVASRAEAWRAQQTYLEQNDSTLKSFRTNRK